MRKLTVTLKPNSLLKNYFDFLSEIESIDFLEMLKLDFDEGIKLMVLNITPKQSLDTCHFPENRVELLNVLAQKDNTYTCLVKEKVPKEHLSMFRLFDLDLIYVRPIKMTQDRFTYTMIGENENLLKFLDESKKFGDIEKTVFKKANYLDHGVLNNLTRKQNEILDTAVKMGYYSYPRKITTKNLAEKIGISKSTLVEHLRKAENRIIRNLTVF